MDDVVLWSHIPKAADASLVEKKQQLIDWKKNRTVIISQNDISQKSDESSGGHQLNY